MKLTASSNTSVLDDCSTHNNGKDTMVTHPAASPKAVKVMDGVGSPRMNKRCMEMPKTASASKLTTAKTIVRSEGMIAILPKGQGQETWVRNFH